MALSRVTNPSDGQTIFSADWRSEFDNIYNNPITLISPFVSSPAAGGFKITGLGAGTANGDSVRYEDIGLRLIQTQAAAASATIDFTAGLTATYDEYLIVLTDVVPATNITDLWVRIHQAGAFLSGAADYYHAEWAFNSTPSTGAAGASGDTKMVLTTGLSSTGANVLGGEVRFFVPSSAASRKAFMWHVTHVHSNGTHTGAVGAGSFLLNTSAIDGIRFVMSAGNITSGTFALYGVRKS